MFFFRSLCQSVPAVPGRFALLFICLSRLPLPSRRSPTPLRAFRPLYVSSSRSDADSLPLEVSSSLSFRTHSRYPTTLYRVGLKIVLYCTSSQRQTRPPPHQLATQDETRTRTNSLLSRLCFSLFLFPQASHLPLYSLTVLANSSLTEPAPPSVVLLSFHLFHTLSFRTNRFLFLFVLCILPVCDDDAFASTLFCRDLPPSSPLMYKPRGGHWHSS